ncbi:uncharacterized protein ALTATR162_LOCUS4962 [Alternaria atra]|uniref:Uncharacterized protein n=1 Tax=Alternaria atra TaxID=119953 RepID=A0A8J2I602_9PLEO|nr:uncharacterized protein ALTATR162_LOCUS4962 [Alternaria atra]CAG5157170.1 unnamed protein product [Alternaria atra]
MAKKKGPPSPSRMFPSLHQEVASAVSEHIPSLQFHEENTDEGTTQTYSTFVMADFKCHYNTCPSRGWKWSSGKVTILIREYANVQQAGNYEIGQDLLRRASCIQTFGMNIFVKGANEESAESLVMQSCWEDSRVYACRAVVLQQL